MTKKEAKAAAAKAVLEFKLAHRHIFQALLVLEKEALVAAKAAGQECSGCDDCSEEPEASGWGYVGNSCGCGGEWYCPVCFTDDTDPPEPGKCPDCAR